MYYLSSITHQTRNFGPITKYPPWGKLCPALQRCCQAKIKIIFSEVTQQPCRYSINVKSPPPFASAVSNSYVISTIYCCVTNNQRTQWRKTVVHSPAHSSRGCQFGLSSAGWLFCWPWFGSWIRQQSVSDLTGAASFTSPAVRAGCLQGLSPFETPAWTCMWRRPRSRKTRAEVAWPLEAYAQKSHRVLLTTLCQSKQATGNSEQFVGTELCFQVERGVKAPHEGVCAQPVGFTGASSTRDHIVCLQLSTQHPLPYVSTKTHTMDVIHMTNMPPWGVQMFVNPTDCMGITQYHKHSPSPQLLMAHQFKVAPCSLHYCQERLWNPQHFPPFSKFVSSLTCKKKWST